MELKQIGAVLARLINISQEELFAGLTKPETEELKDQTEIEQFLEDKFKTKFQKIADNNQGRGQREALTSLERALKSEYGIDSSAKGADLVKEIVEKREQLIAEQVKNPEITEEAVKAHPSFKEAVKIWIEKFETVKGQFDEFRSKTEFDKHAGIVKQGIRDKFLDLNPILPSDEAKKEKAIQSFVNSFDPSDFKIDDSGTITPLKNGEPLEDANYNKVSFPELISNSHWFEIHNQDPNKSSSSPDPAPSVGAGQNKYSFKSQEDLLKFINDPSNDIKDIEAAYKAFEQQQK